MIDTVRYLDMFHTKYNKYIITSPPHLFSPSLRILKKGLNDDDKSMRKNFLGDTNDLSSNGGDDDGDDVDVLMIEVKYRVKCKDENTGVKS